MARLIVLLFLLSVTAKAHAQTVVVDGVKRGTGLIRQAVPASVQYAPAQVAFDALPANYDSVAEGFVTQVKNQGSCGSCWTFARMVAFEAALIKAGKATAKDLNMSEQDVLVNDKSGYGCSGGFMTANFEVKSGVTTEKLCPYKGTTRGQSCKQPKFAKAARWAMVGGRSRSPSIEELKAAVYQYGALAVTVAASGLNPDKTGKLRTCSARSIDHMVAIVGWRTLKDGTTEFKVKNSWGTSHGQGGYFWSRQGCNKLASSPGDAALFISMQ